jgi:hypothetical protein
MTLQEMLEDYERQSNPSRFGITSLSQAASPMSFQFEDATNLYSPEMMRAKELMSTPNYVFNPPVSDPAFFGRNLSGYDYDPYAATKRDFNYLYGTRPGFQYDTSGILNSTPINKGPVGTFTDDAGLEEEDYEEFPEVEKNKKGLAGLFQKIIGFAVPGLNLVRGGLEGIRNFNDRIRNTDFGRSRTLAEYFQRRRDRKAREEAAARGAAKQAAIRERDLQSMRGPIGRDGDGGGFSGGFADNSNASASGGSDEMGSF